MGSPAISAKAKLSKKLCFDLPGHMRIRMSGIMKCSAEVLFGICEDKDDEKTRNHVCQYCCPAFWTGGTFCEMDSSSRHLHHFWKSTVLICCPRLIYVDPEAEFPADEERLAPADSCRSDSRSALVVISRIDPAFYRGCRNHHILFFSPVCDIP